MVLTSYAALAGQSADAGDGHRRYPLTEDWLQGRTAFGGLIAALAVDAMRHTLQHALQTPSPADGGPSLRALQASFIGPLAAGGVDVRVQRLREGRNVRQLQATVLQEGQVAALLLGVWGSERESSLPPHRPPRPAPCHDPQMLPSLPFIPGVVPNFTQHLDLRWDDGPLPFCGGSGWTTSIHLRLKEPQGVPLEQAAVLMADASPTPMLGHFQRMVPASSVSWSLETLPLPPQDDAGWWRADNEAVAVGGGYVNQATRLWAPSGALAALGYQVVAVYG